MLTAPTALLPFDRSPVVFGGFALKERTVEIVGQPSFTDWTRAVFFAGSVFENAPYWWGGLLAYAEERPDWGEKPSQMFKSNRLTARTVWNLTSVYRRVAEPARRLAPTFSHLDPVASLPPEQQTEWLTRARDEEWTVHELRRALRRAGRRGVLGGQRAVAGRFRLLYADPDWDAQPVTRVCDWPVGAFAESEAVLALWVPSGPLLANPGARDVIEAWGFLPRSALIWRTPGRRPDAFVCINHRHLILATRGACLPEPAIIEIDSVQVASAVPDGETDPFSEKPALFREILEQLYPSARKLELCARRPCEGWTTVGSDPQYLAGGGGPMRRRVTPRSDEELWTEPVVALQAAARTIPVLDRPVRLVAGVVYVVLFDGSHHDCNDDLLVADLPSGKVFGQ